MCFHIRLSNFSGQCCIQRILPLSCFIYFHSFLWLRKKKLELFSYLTWTVKEIFCQWLSYICYAIGVLSIIMVNKKSSFLVKCIFVWICYRFIGQIHANLLNIHVGISQEKASMRTWQMFTKFTIKTELRREFRIRD